MVVTIIYILWDFVPCGVVRTNVLENISHPSTGFLRVLGLHSCVTMESLLISLSTEEYYVRSTNTDFCGVFTAVIIIDVFWDFVLSGCS
jgi:hypothetical protein